MGLPQIARGSYRRRQIFGEGTASVLWLGENGRAGTSLSEIVPLCASSHGCLRTRHFGRLRYGQRRRRGWAMQQAAEAAFSCRLSQPMSLENPRDTQLLARRVVGEIAPSTTYLLVGRLTTAVK